MSKRVRAQAFIDAAFPEFFNTHMQGLWRDGRVLACALKAHDIAPADVYKSLDVQSFMRAQYVEDVPAQDWFEQVLRGMEMPSGAFAFALCRQMNIAPHDLMPWCEARLPLPDFLVEAEVLYAEDRVAQGLPLDDATTEFFTPILMAHAYMMEAPIKALNTTHMNALGLVVMATQDLWRGVNYVDNGHDAPVAMHALALKDRLGMALKFGEIGGNVKAKQQVLMAVQKEYDIREKGVGVFAERLARTGAENSFLAFYKDIVRRYGATQAQKVVMAVPDAMLPMLRAGWRHSAHVRLASGKEVKGEDVLMQFCQNYWHLDRAQSQLDQARIDVMDAKMELARWRVWGKSQRTQDFITLCAQAKLINEAIGIPLKVAISRPENLPKYGASGVDGPR